MWQQLTGEARGLLTNEWRHTVTLDVLSMWRSQVDWKVEWCYLCCYGRRIDIIEQILATTAVKSINFSRKNNQIHEANQFYFLHILRVLRSPKFHLLLIRTKVAFLIIDLLLSCKKQKPSLHITCCNRIKDDTAIGC